MGQLKRPRWKRLGMTALVLLALLGAFSLVPSGPSVGQWRTREGQQAYAAAHAQVMKGLPSPTRVLDVSIGGGTVRVYEWRADHPGRPVVLVPGMRSGSAMWAENLPSWIGQRTVYAFDPLGDAGFSAQSVPLKSYEDQGRWIAETMAALRVGPVHLVGHSFGGANAAITAVQHPASVASLTLLEPVMVVRPLPASAYFWATVSSLPLPQSWRDHGLAQLGGVSVEEVRKRTPLSELIAIASVEYSSDVLVPRTLGDEEWRGLPMPVRLDIGGSSTMAGGAAAAERMRQVKPDAVVTLWPGGTHSLPMDERERIGAELLEFWSLHDL